jgi:hypothetical protein
MQLGGVIYNDSADKAWVYELQSENHWFYRM